MITNPTRLFDCVQYHLDRTPIQDMLAGKENGHWKKYSTAAIQEITKELSGGLYNLGIGANDMTPENRGKVMILSKNRPEWIMLDLAVQQAGGVLVPVYPTINVHELEFILNDAQVKIAFVNDEETFTKIFSIKHKVPCLEYIFSFEHVPNAQHWREVFQSCTPDAIEEVRKISEKIQHEDLATIIYTSGTTGTPKGVMLSHKNILSNVTSCIPILPQGENFKTLSFLPLNHIFERMVTYLYLFEGVSVYYAESLDTIAENLLEVKPALFTTVPRLLEKVYERIMQKGSELRGIKRGLFYWAHDLATKYEINKDMGFWYNMKLALARKVIFSKWREGLGNELLCIITGGAACQVKLIRIFTAAGIPIMEGYGLTETSPVISVNRYNVEDRKFGTTGPLISNVEVKIAEDGEVLCKGDNIMMGYYKRPDLTAQEVVDGWFHTGDIGAMVDNKFLKITDRKKELFKTSGGKYVAPLPLENKFKESLYIEQLIVVGAGRKFVSALIVPSFDNLKTWCLSQNIPFTTNEDAVENPLIIDFYSEILKEYNKFFNHVEQIKKFELLADNWTIDAGELTPKLSLRRKVITEKYKARIDAMYDV